MKNLAVSTGEFECQINIGEQSGKVELKLLLDF